MVKRKCTKKQLAALARGRAIRIAKLKKKTKTTYGIPIEEKTEDGKIIKVYKIGKPTEEKSYSKQEEPNYSIIKYEGPINKKQ